MRKALLFVCKKIYAATPLRPVRGLYFDTFARLVRKRRAVADVNGVLFDLDLGESIDLRLYLQHFEPEVMAVLRRETKPGMIVLDIGANIGAHTMLLASLVGPTGRVIAFEPTDYGWQKLRRNLSLNDLPWITPVKAALADYDRAGQRVNFRASWQTDGSRQDTESIVDFVSLDGWCANHGITKVDLVKIDVDGNEYPIFAGGQKILSRSLPTIVMEVVSPHFTDYSRNPLVFLEKLGYRFCDLRKGTKVEIEDLRRRLPAYDPEMTVSMNIIALPPARS